MSKAQSAIPSTLSYAQRGTTRPDTFSQRLVIQHLDTPSAHTSEKDGSDIISGLQKQPKTIPPKYFYDDRGSELFEQICNLPEYYVTRTETQILQNCVAELANLTGPCELVELGSGSSTKTRLLLDAYAGLLSEQGSDAQRKIGEHHHPALHYVPIDISGGILTHSAHQLLEHYDTLNIHGLVGTYTQALQNLPAPELGHRILCFLGSSLGNLNPQECQRFMDQVSTALQPGDYFLLGLDLQKPIEILETAYNDSQGITAAFNLNMLSHLNQRFKGNINPSKFQHWAFYNREHHRIEMHLKSRCQQAITLANLNLHVSLEAGETICTEISRKFDPHNIAPILQGTSSPNHSSRIRHLQSWSDPQSWFVLVLSQRH